MATKGPRRDRVPFKIEKGVALPERRTADNSWAAALSKAELGDSVFLAGGKNGSASSANNFGSGWFATRRMKHDGVEGIRVWKVAEPLGKGKSSKNDAGAMSRRRAASKASRQHDAPTA
jgi:hypothetical protein